MRCLVPLLVLLTSSPACTAQNWEDEQGEFRVDWGGYLFGIRGGASLGNQDWSGLETELMVGYHGDVFLESIPAQGRFSLWAMAGYHTRGSRISRRRAFVFGGNQVTLPADKFEFYNLTLAVGGKSVLTYTSFADVYYLLGLRVDYNLDTNLDEYDGLESTQGLNFRLNYPFESYDFINRFTYGATFGIGANMPLSETVGGFLELTAHPDFSLQYSQGPIPNVIDPFSSNGVRTIPQRDIRNFTIEVTLGLRFLRKWTYVD